MLKGKADGLGMVYSENSSGQIIQIGQHLGQNKIYKTPFIQSSVKSHGMGDAGSFSLLSLRSETILKHIAQCFSVSNFGEISSLEKELSWET